jgi:hypothetical protein
MTTALTWRQVTARRLARHHLTPPGLAPAAAEDGVAVRPADVVRAMCGAHAQVLSAAELSIGLRIPGATRQATRDALGVQRSLVKTFGPRGTVHLLPTEDLPLWTGALSAVPAIGQAPESMRLAPEQVEELIAVIASVLADTELTADELSEQVVANTGSWAGDLVIPAFQGFWPRWRQVIPAAANSGALCYGPNRGRNVTYTNPRRWLPAFRPLEAGQAATELLRRYLFSYGPAAPRHVAQWLNAPVSFADDLFRSLAGELAEVEVDGRRLRLLAGDAVTPADTPEDEPRGVRLLPYFDAYVVGSHPRSLVYPGRAAERALAGGQAGNYPVLLVDGVVAGVWHQRRSGRRLRLTVEPLGTLTRRQSIELDDEVERVGQVLEATPELTVGAVPVGPHA